MNILCTLYISGRKLGTIISLSKDVDSIESVKQEITSKQPISRQPDIASSIRFSSSNNILVLTDMGNGPRVDLRELEDKVVDESLRTLSSNEYIVVTDKVVMHKGKIYQFFGSLPVVTQWKAIPLANTDEIIDYKSTGDIDDRFLGQGYAKEMKDAAYILIPPSWDDLSSTCTLYDLLIKKVEGLSTRSSTKDAQFHPFSNRNISISEPYEIDGRYIYLESTPKFDGSYTPSPYTYSLNTLISKYEVLQYRLQTYGSSKVESVCVSMKSLAQRLRSVTNQFQASSVYEDVVSILEKTKSMD